MDPGASLIVGDADCELNPCTYKELFGFGLYSIVFWLQVIFYLAALLGWYFENRSVRVKLLFVPYYFFIMNLSVFLGLNKVSQTCTISELGKSKKGKLIGIFIW